MERGVRGGAFKGFEKSRGSAFVEGKVADSGAVAGANRGVRFVKTRAAQDARNFGVRRAELGVRSDRRRGIVVFFFQG